MAAAEIGGRWCPEACDLVRELCAAKVLSRAHLQRHGDAAKAIEREKAIMLRLHRALPARAPLTRLIEFHDFGGSLFFILTPRCAGDLLQLIEISQNFSEGFLRELHAKAHGQPSDR